MKTFKDLKFKPHGADPTGTHATMNFPNGYGVSVITGRMFYTDNDRPYELAVLKDDSITYETPITNDVEGHLTVSKVTNIMKKVQAL